MRHNLPTVIASDVKCSVASKNPKFLLILPTFKGGNYNPSQNVWGALSIFHVLEMQIKLISNSPTPPPRTVLGFLSQTPFTYPTQVKDLNSEVGGGKPCMVRQCL